MAESALNESWVPTKFLLEDARERLSGREWSTYMALLTIWVEAETIKLEAAVSE